MKIFRIAFILLVLATQAEAQTEAPNTLTKAEQKAGWKLLFDGKSFNGWHAWKKDKIGSAWKISDDAMYLDASTKVEGQKFDAGDLLTDSEFENYELIVDWKIAPCGNSGIIFNVVEDPKYSYVWLTGPEMQVLDNSCHPDAKIDKHRAGNLYDLIESEKMSVKPVGEWNRVKIISNKGHLELWLNDVKQVSTEMFTPEWEAMIKGSKFKSMPDFGKAKKGRISLQDHGDGVWFRNIKIREIKN